MRAAEPAGPFCDPSSTEAGGEEMWMDMRKEEREGEREGEGEGGLVFKARVWEKALKPDWFD